MVLILFEEELTFHTGIDIVEAANTYGEGFPGVLPFEKGVIEAFSNRVKIIGDVYLYFQGKPLQKLGVKSQIKAAVFPAVIAGSFRFCCPVLSVVAADNGK